MHFQILVHLSQRKICRGDQFSDVDNAVVDLTLLERFSSENNFASGWERKPHYTNRVIISRASSTTTRERELPRIRIPFPASDLRTSTPAGKEPWKINQPTEIHLYEWCKYIFCLRFAPIHFIRTHLLFHGFRWSSYLFFDEGSVGFVQIVLLELGFQVVVLDEIFEHIYRGIFVLEKQERSKVFFQSDKDSPKRNNNQVRFVSANATRSRASSRDQLSFVHRQEQWESSSSTVLWDLLQALGASLPQQDEHDSSGPAFCRAV